MKHNTLVLFFTLVSLLSPLFADPILTIEQPIRQTKITNEQLKDAIISAATEQQWSIMPDGSDLIATYRESNYMAKIRISYSPTGYTIDYADSKKLRYNGNDIHPTYNRLIKALQANIVRNIKSIQQPTADTGHEDDIRSRLRKLKELYEETLITQEEYDAKRKELLDSY